MIYEKEPEDFIPTMEVVGCLIESNNKILLLKRQDNKLQPDMWGVPGGKIDKDDINTNNAVLREIKEETGLVIKEDDLKLHKTFYVIYPEKHFIYHHFCVNLKEIPEIIISLSEHKAYCWMTIDEALNSSLIMDEDYCLKDYYGIK